MAARDEERQFSFNINLEGKPERSVPLNLYAFGPDGRLLGRGDVLDGQATLTLTPAQAGRARLFIAPAVPDRKPTLQLMERNRAYEPIFKFNNDQQRYQLHPVPDYLWPFWPFEPCHLQGRVVKPVPVGFSTVDMPVCHARVHICEVDPWWLILRRLPDDILWRLRNEILVTVQPPIPHGPGPDPGPEMLPMLSDISQVGMGAMPEAAAALSARQAVTRTNTPLIESQHVMALRSHALPNIRTALSQLGDYVAIQLCNWRWFWPYYSCEEIAVLETDDLGRFDATRWFSIFDQPDLYFWVEFCIGNTWTTVYDPAIACNTFWNYDCGSEVTIRVTDSRVPWCGYVPTLPGCQIGVLTVGNNENVSTIQGAAAGAAQGLTADGRPFAGSLEPHVWFGEDLASCGVAFYRWSYRPLGSSGDWFVVDDPVIRHYGVITGGILTFLPDLMGPTGTDLLFRIQPLNPPAGTWAPMVDARSNTASAFFRSDKAGNTTPVAGKFELKLELFDAARNLVNCTDAGISFRMPDPLLPAPFGAATVTTVAAPNENLLLDTNNKVVAFRLVLHVDNNPCEAAIYPVSVGVQAANDCGFLQLSGAPQVHISFKANHPNGFATFSFAVDKGSSGAVTAATVPTGGASAPLVTVASIGAYTNLGAGLFAGDPTVASLMGGCPQAAFAETLYVAAMATDGWGIMTSFDRSGTPMAFALTP